VYKTIGFLINPAFLLRGLGCISLSFRFFSPEASGTVILCAFSNFKVLGKVCSLQINESLTSVYKKWICIVSPAANFIGSL
jgi:hypothetical protein